MTTRVVPPGNGPRWLAQGWALFRASPLAWTTLVFSYWLLVTFVSVLPFVGVLIATVLVPPLSVGFMAAARAAATGERPALGHLFEGLRQRRAPQLALGGFYAALLAALIGATTLADDGALARLFLGGARPEIDVLESTGFAVAIAMAGGLYLLVSMLYWFAPVLVAWHGHGAVQALFYSFFAVLLNWRAFLVYGVVTALLTVAIPFVTLWVLLMATGANVRLATPLLFSFLIVLMPVLFASFYASYRDIFDPEPGVAGSVEPGSDDKSDGGSGSGP